MLLDLEALRGAAGRFAQRTSTPDSPRPPETTARLAYLARGFARDRAKAMVTQADSAGLRGTQIGTVESLSQERIVGRSDLVDVNYLELAIAIARGIARVRLPNGAGTGVLVGNGVLMTNHHVLPDAATAQASVAQFDYQENSAGQLLEMHAFALEPRRLFITDAALDYTLVAVAPRSARGRAIGGYPWTKLIGTIGKAEKGDAINIIQHPLGGLKQIAFRDNEIIDIPANRADFLYYTTDTQPGSSGAPCFNDQWELVALHHQGVPKTNAAGNPLKRDGNPYQPDRDSPDSIAWLANEGARVSAIVRSLRSAPKAGEATTLVDTLLDSAPPNPIELARAVTHEPSGSSSVSNDSRGSAPGLSVIIDIAGDTIHAVRVEGPEARRRPVAPPRTPSLELPPPVLPSVTPGGALSLTNGAGVDTGTDETTAIDPDWQSRQGYDPDFLDEKIPLPVLSAAQAALSVTVPPEFRKKPSDKLTLHYHHYSLAMHAKRRTAWYSAANIDGDRMRKLTRGTDKWFIDPRIDDVSNPVFQMGEELYATADTDRGHLTRFLDVAWGKNAAEALAATNDTFHFTNCSLQLSGFNRGKDRWQGIEQFLLEQKARKEQRRMSVFTGPVFKKNDPVYRNKHMDYSIRIPLQFWKVCVLIREDETLAATGFLLGQPDITDLPGFEEKFDVTAVQVTIKHLEALTRLDFGKLTTHDHFAKGGEPGTLEVFTEGVDEKQRVLPLESVEQIVV